MIELRIISKDGKVFSNRDEEDLKQKEVALLLYEFERIKLELLSYTFDGDVKVEKND